MELSKSTFYRLFMLIVLSITYYLAMQNVGEIFGFIGVILSILRPVLIGLIIAFVLNVPMTAFEKYVFTEPFYCQSLKTTAVGRFFLKTRHFFSLLFALAIFFSFISIIVFFVIPAVINTISELLVGFPTFLERVQKLLLDFLNDNPDVEAILASIQLDWQSIINRGIEFIQKTGVAFVKNTLSATSGIFSFLLEFLLSLILAIYILLAKQDLHRQFLKLIHAYVRPKYLEPLFYVLRLSHKTFSSYVSGQFLEACILGTLCYIGMNILGLPFSTLIAVLVIMMQMIPIVGAFVSATVGTLLILTQNSTKALVFLIFLLCLQQFEGYLIYPHVVGKSVELSGLWVLAAISVGGSLGGMVGILLSIPVFSVIYTLIRQSVNRKLLRQQGPYPTKSWFDRSFYMFSEIEEEYGKNVKPFSSIKKETYQDDL